MAKITIEINTLKTNKHVKSDVTVVTTSIVTVGIPKEGMSDAIWDRMTIEEKHIYTATAKLLNFLHFYSRLQSAAAEAESGIPSKYHVEDGEASDLHDLPGFADLMNELMGGGTDDV